MASCTQIEQLHQAYIDGQLGHRDRVIVDQHMGECSGCRKSFRRQQRTSALLFETFAEHRLSRDLTQSILENLPETQGIPVDIAGVNWRAKHPGGMRRHRLTQVSLGAVALLLVFGAYVIRDAMLRDERPFDAIGVATAVHAEPTYLDQRTEEIGVTELADYAMPHSRYETGEDAYLMISLAGPTNIKLNHNTSIVVHNAREITVDRGQVYFEVGKGKGLFHVTTPTGVVTVTGTSFDVRTSEKMSTVALVEGEVTVDHNDFASSFAQLRPGYQVEIIRNVEITAPQKTDIREIGAWARDIEADKKAYALFVDEILSQYETEEIVVVRQPRRENHFMLKKSIKGRYIDSITLNWSPGTMTVWDYCGYVIYVYGDDDRPLFKGEIRGEDIAKATDNSFTMASSSDKIVDTHGVYLKFVPDHTQGEIETRFSFIHVKTRKVSGR